MVGVLRAHDFEVVSYYGGPGTLRDYRLRHLPTGMEWDERGCAGYTTLQKMRQLFARANCDLIALGWEPGEDWQQQMAKYVA